MSIFATRKDGVIIILDGKMRLISQIKNNGFATVVDGQDVIVVLNENNEIVEKSD